MRLSARPADLRGSSTYAGASQGGTSPEEIFRKMLTRWANGKLASKGVEPLRDLRDLLRTEKLVALCEVCIGGKVPDSVENPSVRDHDRNVAAVVNALATRTTIEWGPVKVIKGVQEKNMGFLEVLGWVLVEVGEFIPMGLPVGQEKLTSLAAAIEQRLSRYISLKQFHFRYAKEMIFDIVNNCSSWTPDHNANDVQNLRACFKNIDSWGVPVIVDPEDVKHMGSVNEKAFLLLFALFIPSLEGITGPKKQRQQEEVAKPPPALQPAVSVEDLKALEAKVIKLEREKSIKAELAEEANQRAENLSMESDDLKTEVQRLQDQVSKLRADLAAEVAKPPKVIKESNADELRNLRNELEMTTSRFTQHKSDCEQHKAQILQSANRIAELEEQLRVSERARQEAKKSSESLELRLKEAEERADKLADRLRAQDFDGLEAKYLALIQELNLTQGSLKEARSESETLLRKLHALELKMPLYLRQGKNLVPPPTGEVTLAFTDVEGSTVQWEWDADNMAIAIRVHNELMRNKLHEHGGYEVKTEGDAFMVAFQDPIKAVIWCLDVQESLLDAKWPEALYAHEKSKIVESDKSGRLLYKGLRVRMGLHTGSPTPEEDPVTGRMDYFGPMVNRSARVESVANGGQVVMSSDVYNRVRDAMLGEEMRQWKPQVVDLGDFELKGLNESTHILQVLPHSLSERKFEAIRSKEQELAEEKQKLQEQLAEMERKNDELNARLKNMDSDVQKQMDQANKLLVDVRAARMEGAPPAEMLDVLGKELSKLLEGQTATAKELQAVQVTNEELFKEATRAAGQREALFEEERKNLQSDIVAYQGQLEEVKLREESLKVELVAAAKRLEYLQSVEADLAAAGVENRELKQEIRELEDKLKRSREDRVELMHLRVTVNELQAALEGKGPMPGSEEEQPSRIVGPSGPKSLDPSPKAAARLERALQFKICYGCDLAVKDDEFIEAAGRIWHQQCLACGVCGKLIPAGERFYEYRGRPAHDLCRGDDY